MTYIQTTSPRTAVFYGESMADLALMPTTTKIGEGEYIHALAQAGSYAIILLADGLKKFMLRSTGWVEITDQGGGGGGTGDYNDLINKPTINDITVQGAMTSDDIDVAPEPRVVGENLIFG